MNDRNRGRGYEPRDDRDGWQRQNGSSARPAYPDRGRGMSTRDYGYGQAHDALDPEQVHRHGRAVGENGYGPEYRAHDGYGASDHAPIGKGPKNYVRSDERLREEICERLSEQPLDWSDVEVHVSDGEATLSGTVRTRETKYVGERIAESVRGIRDVMNQIRIAQEPRASSEPAANGHGDKRARSTMVSR